MISTLKSTTQKLQDSEDANFALQRHLADCEASVEGLKSELAAAEARIRDMGVSHQDEKAKLGRQLAQMQRNWEDEEAGRKSDAAKASAAA